MCSFILLIRPIRDSLPTPGAEAEEKEKEKGQALLGLEFFVHMKHGRLHQLSTPRSYLEIRAPSYFPPRFFVWKFTIPNFPSVMPFFHLPHFAASSLPVNDQRRHQMGPYIQSSSSSTASLNPQVSTNIPQHGPNSTMNPQRPTFDRSASQSRYIDMLLSLDTIPRSHNLFASFW